MNTHFFSENTDDIYIHYIEKNPHSLDLNQKDNKYHENPLIEVTKRKFDQHDLKGLFLVNLELDESLSLVVNPCEKSSKQ